MALFGGATNKIHLFSAICRGHITPFISSLVGFNNTMMSILEIAGISFPGADFFSSSLIRINYVKPFHVFQTLGSSLTRQALSNFLYENG